jgi:3-keto-5-aminohexanoate cleavage enzyme
MEKLVITVTCDSTITYPANPYMPKDRGHRRVGRQYVDSVNAGASICHHHGASASGPGGRGSCPPSGR